MKNHTDLLNYLIQTFDLKSYLEIGVQNPKNNFDKINLSNLSKYGVDPNPIESACRQVYKNTSDEWFNQVDVILSSFDLIFIDGLHHADQVRRDFENSLKCLSDNGFIVIHDTLPTEEKYTRVPRDSKIWYGNVYKFAMTLQGYSGISFITVDMDCGCTVVWKDERKEGRNLKGRPMDWGYYQDGGRGELNVSSVFNFIELIEKYNLIHKNFYPYITNKS